MMGVDVNKQRWVVGFLFSGDGSAVVLIRKNRPEWQAGKLNGVGGKMEDGDRSIEEAMVRAFAEETGWSTLPGQWHHFTTLEWEEGSVHFLRAFDEEMYRAILAEVASGDHAWPTDENIECHYVKHLPVPEVVDDVTPNLRWLVPLAAHRHDTYEVIRVVETGTTLRKTKTS